MEASKNYGNLGRVILVDEDDNAIGTMEKLDAHGNQPRLHRAFSVFIFNSAGRMLIHRRASSKYHFGGLWTNACCSHPWPGEATADAAARRLREEMGIETELREVFSFIYRAEDPGTGLVEWEYDHVFTGTFDGAPSPDLSEAEEWRWVEVDAVKAEMTRNPSRFTPWFMIACAKWPSGLR